MSGPRLEGKVALITGAAGGIGSAAARRLAGEGAQLLLTDADGERAQALARDLGDCADALAHDVTSEEQWQAVVAHAMIERHAGSIVNVSSVAGLTGPPYLTAYAASKWAVRGMSKVAAKELAQFTVRVNSLHPGQIDTDMNTRQREQTPELIDKLIGASRCGASAPPRRSRTRSRTSPATRACTSPAPSS